MDRCFCLLILVAISALASPLSIKPKAKETDPDVIDIGEDKDITEINKDLGDDIIVPKGIQRSAVNNPLDLWALPVPYVLDKSLDLNAKGVILRSLDQFRLKSCIDFKIKGNEEYYLSVEKRGGCYSYVGRYLPNGQTLSIGSYCDTNAIVEHEFLHALGFNHEQSRYDRDEHVTIQFQNIQQGFEGNFEKVSKEYSQTHGVAYDYMSVMHYSSYAFSNGNGSTITTKDPTFQDIIGQRLEMSPSDVKELNLLYKCNSSVSFLMHCSFSNMSTCGLSRCSQGGRGWENVTKAPSGPATDRTNLQSHSKMHDKAPSSFMHASTAFGPQGASSWLETRRMTPGRSCSVQCLQFYYFHSGNESDQLNIWIREFQDETDVTGQSRLFGRITGQRTTHWKYHHVSLGATKSFQVEFEARKGAGSSSGGFSIDDINLSELECPHVAIQINDFEKAMESSGYDATVYSPVQYTDDGYAFRMAALLSRSYFGLAIQMVEGKNDDKLQWPFLNRQITFQALDQNPSIQLQMSNQKSMTSDASHIFYNDTTAWDNPRTFGQKVVDENGREIYVGPLIGRTYFATLDEIKQRDFLKGGSAVFVFSVQDITPLINGSSLPCAVPTKAILPFAEESREPCSRSQTTTFAPPHPALTTPEKTTVGETAGPTSPFETTAFYTTEAPEMTTRDRSQTTTFAPPPPAPTTHEKTTIGETAGPTSPFETTAFYTTEAPEMTTSDRYPHNAIWLEFKPKIADNQTECKGYSPNQEAIFLPYRSIAGTVRIKPTTPPPAVTTASPETTTDDSIFGFAPGLVSSALLTFFSALLLLFH